MSKIAVVVPTFRRRHVLHLLYKAFQAQDHRKWALYLSYVDPADVLKSEDARIIAVRATHRGAAGQRNDGLRHALRDPEISAVCFFDDDDTPFQDYLSTLVGLLRDNPKARAASCLVADPMRGGLWRQARYKEKGRYFGSPIFRGVPGTTPGFLYRRDVVLPAWDTEGWHQNARYAAAVLGYEHVLRADVHIERVLAILGRDLTGGLHHPEKKF